MLCKEITKEIKNDNKVKRNITIKNKVIKNIK